MIKTEIYASGVLLSKEARKKTQKNKKTDKKENQTVLLNKYDIQWARVEALGVRMKFQEKLSLKLIQPNITKNEPNFELTEAFVTNTFSTNSQDKINSPVFNDWIR